MSRLVDVSQYPSMGVMIKRTKLCLFCVELSPMYAVLSVKLESTQLITAT